MSISEQRQIVAEEVQICPICHEHIEYFSFGKCNHKFCAKCMLKIKLFENVRDVTACPTCRTNLEEIVVTKNPRPFQNMHIHLMKHTPQVENIAFDGMEAHAYFCILMACKCPMCPAVYSNMANLNTHTSIAHNLHYCSVCIEHAHLFPSEFDLLSQEQLLAHSQYRGTKGGHPDCQFCAKKFYDFDTLLVHARSQHFICDLCARRRRHHFFQSQADLCGHYRQSHFVCDQCAEEDKMMAFESQLELASHLEVHAVNGNKGTKTNKKRRGQVLLSLPVMRGALNTVAPSLHEENGNENDVRFAFGAQPSRQVSNGAEVAWNVSSTSSVQPLLSVDDFPQLPQTKSAPLKPRHANSTPVVTMPCRPSPQPTFPPTTSSRVDPLVCSLQNLILQPAPTGSSYHPSKTFHQRNADLFANMKNLLGEQKFQAFVQLAGAFRKGQLTAVQFYRDSRHCFGAAQWTMFLPELVAVLDDIPLQRRLLHILSVEERSDLVECGQCGQVLHCWETSEHVRGAHLL